VVCVKKADGVRCKENQLVPLGGVRGIAVNLRSLRKELHGRSIKANGLKY